MNRRAARVLTAKRHLLKLLTHILSQLPNYLEPNVGNPGPALARNHRNRVPDGIPGVHPARALKQRYGVGRRFLMILDENLIFGVSGRSNFKLGWRLPLYYNVLEGLMGGTLSGV